MGFITDSRWFTELTRAHLIRFIRELRIYGNIELQISNQTKSNIYPNGNPFQE